MGGAGLCSLRACLRIDRTGAPRLVDSTLLPAANAEELGGRSLEISLRSRLLDSPKDNLSDALLS